MGCLQRTYVQAHADPGGCDRAVSREVRRVLSEYILPQVRAAGLELPHSCRLHQDHDMYYDQEKHKTELRHNAWKCLYCSKTFRGEVYLDKHMHNRHSNMTQGPVCLADYVAVLHSKALNTALRVRPSKEQETLCSEAEVKDRALICRNLFNMCVPPEMGETAALLHDFFLATLCAAHTCNKQTQRKLLLSVLQKSQKNQSWGWSVLSGFLVIITIAIYGILLLMRHAQGGFSNTPDLQRRRSRPSRTNAGLLGGVARWLGIKPKSY